MHRNTPRHLLRALWRDTYVLLRQFRFPLLTFVLLVCVGTLILYAFYRYPETGQRLGLGEAFYATFMLTLADPYLPLPDAIGLQILFFVIPAVGLGVVADGVIRFGVALFNRRERKEAWQVAIASTYRNHVIVCGLGKVGYRVAKELLRLGEEVVGIEQNEEGPFLEELRQMNIPVLIGDARQRDMLEKAGLHEASAIAICTQADLTNLDIALDARDIRPDVKVVMRMFDGQLAEKVRRGFEIHTAFSTSALAAPVFAAAATRAKIDQSFYLDGVLMNVACAFIGEDSALIGDTIAQIEQLLDLTVVLYKGTDTSTPHPSPGIELQAGDCLTVFASLESLARLREMSGEVCPTAPTRKRKKTPSTLLNRLLNIKSDHKGQP